MSRVEELLKEIREKYTDSFGLITTSQMDGGDSSHKMNHAGLAAHLYDGNFRFSFACIMKTREYGLRRHPDTSKWYSNTQTFSRDQFAPRIMLCALMYYPGILKEYFFAHLKRALLFAWNTRPSWNEGTAWKVPDITSPFEFWGFYIRGFRCKLLYPWLILADIETVISAIIKRFDSDFDINNCLAAVLLARKVMPTGLGHLAWWILKPVVEKKLRQYWDPNRYEPPIGELYIEALKKEGLL